MDITIQAGDNFTKEFDYPDYPSTAGWTLKLALRNKTSQIDIIATEGSGGRYIVTLTAAQTAAYTSGKYLYKAYVEKSTDRYAVEDGIINILPNYTATTSTYDGKSQAEKTLEAVEATILGRATSDHMSYQIAGRSISKIPIPDLLILRDRLRIDVAREIAANNIANGRPSRKKIAVRF